MSDDLKTPTCDFQIGDHVYQWCSLAGIPAVFQHHGIVLDCVYDEGEGAWKMQVLDFSNQSDDHCSSSSVPSNMNSVPDSSFTGRTRNSKKRSFGSSPSSSAAYAIRTYEVDLSKEKWHRVHYQAGWWQRQFHRSGTCTAVPSDPPGLVRARAQFLREHPEWLPEYDAVAANCECVAVWCKTGTWGTLQAVHWLAMTAAGQVKSAAVMGSMAAATQVTVSAPAAGFWGWMGYTTTAQVSLLATQPYLLPAIIGYGVVTVAAPTIWLLRVKHLAQRTTERLNTAFWEQAVDQPEVFVECITNWSTQYQLTDGEAECLKVGNFASPAVSDVLSVVPDQPIVVQDTMQQASAVNLTESNPSMVADPPPIVVQNTIQDASDAPQHQEEFSYSTEPKAPTILQGNNEQSAGQQSLEGGLPQLETS